MQKECLFFTVGQFAGLHHLNKRTLQYYDDIGLFSPAHKGENGYRYYTCHQSAELENILALRELGMSIEEIKNYSEQPNAEAFLKIALQKTREINEQIRRLKGLKTLLQEKQEALALCAGAYDGKIEVIKQPEKLLLFTPLQYQGTPVTEMERIMAHLQTAWECTTYKTNCGSYISLHKVKQGQFDVYDGLFTEVDSRKKGVEIFRRAQGRYLRGYCSGDWSKIPSMYGKLLDYAEKNRLRLTGNCYEKGLNEFAISRTDEYVTQIEIQLI